MKQPNNGLLPYCSSAAGSQTERLTLRISDTLSGIPASAVATAPERLDRAGTRCPVGIGQAERTLRARWGREDNSWIQNRSPSSGNRSQRTRNRSPHSARASWILLLVKSGWDYRRWKMRDSEGTTWRRVGGCFSKLRPV